MSRARAVYDMVLQDKSAVGRRSFLGSLDKIDNRAAAMAVGGVTALGVAGATAFTLMYNAQAPLIDQLGKMSEKLGVGVESLQAFQDAGERADVPLAVIEKALQKMSVGVSDAANGIGTAVGALDELGISAEELNRLSPDEQFKKISDALSEIDSQGDKLRLAEDFFGGRGVSLIRLTTGAINEAEQEMRDLDLALNEINVANVEYLNDQLQRVGRFTSQSSKVFVAEMAPAISAVLSETLALDSGMLSARSTAQLLADSTITATGFLGDGINGLKNSYSFVELQLQRLNVQANKFQARIAPTPEALATLEKSREILQLMDDTLAGETGALSYSERLRRSYDLQAEAAQQALAEQKKALSERQALVDALNNKSESDGGGTGKPAKAEDGGDDIEEQIRKELEREEARAQADDERAIAAIQRDIDRRREYSLTEEQLLLEEQERTAAILDEIAARDISRTDEVNAAKEAANQQYHDEYLQLAKERSEEANKREREQMQAGRSYLEQGIAHFAQKSEAADVLHKALVARRMFREGREAVIGAYKWGASIAGPAGGAVAAAVAGAYTAALIAETVGGGQSTTTAASTVDLEETTDTSLSDSASSAAQTTSQQQVVYNAYFPATAAADREAVARQQLADDIAAKRIVIGDNVDVQVNVFDYEDYGT